MATPDHHRAHRHGSVHIDEADWSEQAEQTEREGELLLGFLTDTVTGLLRRWGRDAPPVQQVLDIGCGPGVGTCELARLFPDAQVVAVDGSPAMLDRARRRAAALGFDERITTHLAELPDGLDGLDGVDLIWASMSLHHVGDEVAALRRLRDLLLPSGLIAIAELADPMRLLPDELGLGRPGLVQRLEGAEAAWFGAMRHGLSGEVPSTELSSMLASAGFDVADSRLARLRFDPPLADDTRRVVLGHLRRTRDWLDERLDEDDRRTLEVLTDVDDPRGVMHRTDVFVAASRQIVIAQPTSRR